MLCSLRRAAAACVLVAATGSSARAAALAYEPFEYGGTTLGGQGGGSSTGFSGTWTDNSTPPNNTTNPGGFAGGVSGAVALSGDSSSLSFPGVAASGARVSDADGGYATRALTTNINYNTNATYYASALIRGSGVVQFDNATYSLASFGIRNGQFVSATRDLASTASATYAGGTYDANTTYLMVAKIVGTTSGNDSVSVSIYDPSMTVPTTDPGVYDRTSNTGSTQATSRLALIAFAGTSNEIDNVRFGTTWGDVVPVPEPTSAAALAAAAGAGLLARRRRRA
ncbi:MAG TPA: PEP-CTERM sorting domain-containing protein [Humisphaera sp.]